jgi:hypothetical protein
MRNYVITKKDSAIHNEEFVKVVNGRHAALKFVREAIGKCGGKILTHTHTLSQDVVTWLRSETIEDCGDVLYVRAIYNIKRSII